MPKEGRDFDRLDGAKFKIMLDLAKLDKPTFGKTHYSGKEKEGGWGGGGGGGGRIHVVQISVHLA